MQRLIATLGLLLASSTAVAAGAHQHGTAELQVAVEGKGLEVSFSSPLENLVGFEHAPRNDKERAAMTAMKEHFSQPGKLLAPTAAARCSAQPAVLEVPEQAGGHADLTASVTFSCEAPAQLKGLELRIFDAFPRLQRVRVEVAAPGRQTAADLDRRRRSVNW